LQLNHFSEILSYRSTDLQTSYEALAMKANERKRGVQVMRLSLKERNDLRKQKNNDIRNRKKVEGE